MLKKIVPALMLINAFAAYGPAPVVKKNNTWTLGIGYGQMFGMNDATYTSGNGGIGVTNIAGGVKSPIKIETPHIFEVDLFHCHGYGAVFMSTAKKADLNDSANNTLALYSFQAYMAGYQKQMAEDVFGRVVLGVSNQKLMQQNGADIVKSSGKLAYGASAAWHKELKEDIKGFAELGYLGQKKMSFNANTEIKTSGFYWKLGLKTDF